MIYPKVLQFDIISFQWYTFGEAICLKNYIKLFGMILKGGGLSQELYYKWSYEERSCLNNYIKNGPMRRESCLKNYITNGPLRRGVVSRTVLEM